MLHYSAVVQSIKVACFLLRRGAAAEIQTNDGDTFLQIAKNMEHEVFIAAVKATLREIVRPRSSTGS